jgi:O-antigen/teichoic acid export membrane protein
MPYFIGVFNQKTTWLARKWKAIFQSSSTRRFVKNVSIVMTGSVLAQVIGLCITPVISRLFDPADFGFLGAFNSILTVVAAGATLQFSQAVMLPKRVDDAVNIFALSIISVVVVTVVSLSSVYILSDWLVEKINNPGAFRLIWLLPMAIFIKGVIQSVQVWCVRKKAFKRTAASQIIRGVSNNIFQIFCGSLQYGGPGLVISAIAADGAACLNLSRQVIVSDWELIKREISWKRIVRLGAKYIDFPKYSATQHVMNALSQGLPVLLLAHYYGIGIAGTYAFGIRVLHAPMTFMLTALRQVLFQQASETFNNGSRLFPMFIKLTLGLLSIGSFPTLILFIWAPDIFSWVFGIEWYDAGAYARWLSLWLLPAFCNVPAALFGRILRQQKNLFLFEVLVISSRITVLVIGGCFFTALNTIVAFSAVGAILNVLLIVWIGTLLKR